MENKPENFIEQIINDDISSGFNPKELKFRFPPEPNGYLHIGHAKAIGLNFGLGKKYDAPVNLRFDDTNPTKEDQEFVTAIKEDVKWLGYDWSEVTYSSDNFQKLYDWSLLLTRHATSLYFKLLHFSKSQELIFTSIHFNYFGKPL